MRSFYRFFVLIFALVHQGSCTFRSAEDVVKAFDTVKTVSEQTYAAILPWSPSLTEDVFNSVIDNARPCQVGRKERFSRADGVCNNLNQPFLGAALSIHRRLFTNAYLDGVGMPRTQTESGHDLPNAVELGQRYFAPSKSEKEKDENRQFIQLMEHFGQFLSQDIALARRIDGLDCCGVGLECVSQAGECFPMLIPEGLFESNETCIEFTRSSAVTICEQRDQVNLGSSFIDASNVYGPSTINQRQIRVGTQGQLIPQRGSRHHGVTGELLRGSDVLRSLFQFEHNRIARKLFLINPLWDDERIFQETRKIIIAIMQKIVYEDYLPLVIGNDVIRVFHLDGYFVYDNSINPSAITEFVSAAFRFVGDKPVDTDEVAEINNRTFTLDFLSRLANSTNGLKSFDRDPLIAASHIHSGRDHGIPSYTVVRDACRDLLEGVPGVIQEFPKKLIEGFYRSEEDVDLFVGGASETNLEGAWMGPTFACVVGLQFQRLKFGDRFFYDGGLPEGFEEDRKDFIRRNTLAGLICTLDENQFIQRNVFLPVSETNPLTSCHEINIERNLDAGLELWRHVIDQRVTRRHFVSFDQSTPCDD